MQEAPVVVANGLGLDAISSEPTGAASKQGSQTEDQSGPVAQIAPPTNVDAGKSGSSFDDDGFTDGKTRVTN